MEQTARENISNNEQKLISRNQGRQQYTIKGIEAEALELVRSAAHREGMKIGAWVSARLKEAASNALQEQGRATAEVFAEVSDYIRKIERNQHDEEARLKQIENELAEIARAQRAIMTSLLASREQEKSHSSISLGAD